MDIMQMKLLITFICLLINGYFDLKNRSSHTFIYLVAYAALYYVSPSILPIILGLITLIFNRDNNLVGGGDLDAAFLIFYTVGIKYGFQSIVIACILSIVFWMIRKNKEIPFVTMLFLGYSIIIGRMILL